MEGVVVHAARDKQYSDVNEAEETIQEIDKCSEFVGQQKRFFVKYSSFVCLLNFLNKYKM